MTESCTVAGLHTLEGHEIVRRIRSREVSRREVLEAHLERIEAVNGAVNAIVDLRDREESLGEADAADRDHERRAGLPLDGVPVSIKDHFDVIGLRHTEGVRAWAERRSPGNSAVVQRLLDAGATVIGKANQPDFTIRWNTVNALYGATRNPRDLRRSAGGSSGGDAAAVAAGMAVLGLGTDYGGSIRVPATFCGVFGLRPSAGRVPQVQVLDPDETPPTADLMWSNGPLARSLDDLWTAFRVLSGPDPRDPTSLPLAAPPAGGERCDPPTIARLVRQTGAVVEAEVEAELDRVCRALEAAGYRIVDADFPGGTRAPELWAELIGPELLFAAMPAWADLIADSNRQHIEAMFGGVFLPENRVDHWVAAYAERRKVAHRTALWMEEHPLVVAPVAGMPTPLLDFDEYLSAEATRDLFDQMRNIGWVNLLGLPSLALPNGIQLVARRFREHEALAAAEIATAALPPVAVADVPV
jgi:amidase